MKKATKKERSQLSHIKSPTIDKTGDKAKQGTVKNTVKDTEKKFGGNAGKLGIKLKKGKK